MQCAMLEALHQAESEIQELLAESDAWESMLIDYHPPVVERVWRQCGKYRISLHRIHPCAPQEALFHPHPWPSAIRIISGSYVMQIGFGRGAAPPPVAATVRLGEQDEYEMPHRSLWHSVQPVGEASISLMVTGPPWKKRSARGPGQVFAPLEERAKREIMESVWRFYCPEPYDLDRRDD